MFAQTLPGTAPSPPFIILSKVDSTNNYAMAKLHAGLLEHGTTILAFEQTTGKGQRRKNWFSEAGENITMSTVFSLPVSFSATALTKIQSFPFLLSAAVALSCYDFIKGFNIPDIKIKWPNDLYIRDRKAGGILIENLYRATEWTWAVCGIGINMNQVTFGDNAPRATSIALQTKETYHVWATARHLQQLLGARMAWLNETTPAEILFEYNRWLFKAGEEVRLRRDNAAFSTTILHVDLHGRLHTADVIERIFEFGEVEFL